MLQVVENLQTGQVTLSNVPSSIPSADALLVRSTCSLVSSGTERMLLDFGRGNWLAKARQQPDKVRAVLEKTRTDGVAATLDSVRTKLSQPVALGYCNVGRVIEIGSGVEEFRVGDRVLSNGVHAEVIAVPKNLATKIPDGVSDEMAVHAVLGAIGLQGIRLAQPTLGETFVVMGLGLIGLLTVQILRANGCRVLAIDPDLKRLELACAMGAHPFNPGHSVDGVIITAATKSNEPVRSAAQICRKRGRIILVGVTGIELSREEFYKKELSFQVSCSYGPGRYDPSYEEKGNDYPLPYVRWTAQRNFAAVLELMADHKLEVEGLISDRFRFEQAEKAYELLLSDEPHLGILLEYGDKPAEQLLARSTILKPATRRANETPAIAVIGAGNYATKVLLPALQNSVLKVVADANGLAAAHAGRRFGFEEATTDVNATFARDDLDTILIATRHDSHARLVCQALRAGKKVWVEKPLAMFEDELDEIEAAQSASPGILMVGFNRRFAPQIVKANELLSPLNQPKAIVITVNAGAVPADHWTQDPRSGGGRIIGEACHFIDLARFLAGVAVESVQTTRLASDSATITLRYRDGSIATIHYFANGEKSFPKERIEIFCGGRILQLDNFRKLRGYGWVGFQSQNLWRQDKGNAACVAAFVDAVRTGKASPIPFEQLVEVTRTTISAAR